ncbi:putative cobalamin synthesis protein [Actinomycetospora sp. NBRC 106375]|uniref:ribosome hibernation factor-recruiting GTPase MRF n=1 Tax=Actinomycetospora sp. NBRC 106375 TaxID=3032207 RepID=UPI00249FA079|nr:GTP-binding protein [Actinomycetospora sp. NBRC 106375]GLZ47916.1 putative cobalamin synthesis protein [Actinomycetospora sp. NBRC 106375]
MPEGAEIARAGLTLVSGADRVATAAVAAAVRCAATGSAGERTRTTAVLVAHDLRGLGEGVVHRRVVEDDGEHDAVLELAHGCVACTLREDLLPLLVCLARDPEVGEVVLLLDPGVEPEAVCEALHALVPDGAAGPVTDLLALRGVVTVLDAAIWLDDAGGDDTLAGRGLALTGDDERTVAQMIVGSAEPADVLVVAGRCPTPWDRVRLEAVLDRLAPRAVRLTAPESPADLAGAPELAADLGAEIVDRLATLPSEARRGAPEDAHTPLLRGQPPLTRDAGVSLLHVGHRRPFHPERLHAAIDVLLHGTVRVRGRVWVASQPEHVLWLESAGGALQIGPAGTWLAADPQAWDDAGDERRAAAALSWDERFGDREQQIVALVHDAAPAGIVEALDAALLTDAELALGEEAWRRFPDPFEHRHVDPCEDVPEEARHARDRGEG